MQGAWDAAGKIVERESTHLDENGDEVVNHYPTDIDLRPSRVEIAKSLTMTYLREGVLFPDYISEAKAERDDIPF